MKNGYKHKTGAFGTAAENYVSRLFMLLKNPDGDRRPDLSSVGETYNPVLSVEVKSGAKSKGVLVDYQLHYSIRTLETYRELFGENPPQRRIETELFSEPILERGRIEKNEPIAYYYCVTNRIDGLKSDELDRPYATVKCEWGSLFMVPAELAFHAFVAARVKRTGEKEEPVIKELREMMKRDALAWNSTDYLNRKLNPNSWQNLNGRDILSIFMNDSTIATAHGKDRIEVIARNYESFAKLQRVQIPGPNNTSIYALVTPQDYNLFDKQVRNVVESRVPKIEKISRARKNAVALLKRINPWENPSMFCFGDHGKIAQMNSRQFLKPAEIDRLERLVNWLDVGEHTLIADPF